MVLNKSETLITFIGGGNMAAAMIGGLIAAGIPSTNIMVSEPWEVNRNKVKETFKVNVTTDNKEALHFNGNDTSVLILAVKPQVMKTVASDLANVVPRINPLVITIAAGITITALSGWLGGSDTFSPAIVRVMPNTPALVQEGATGAFASPAVSDSQRSLSEVVLDSISKKLYWVDNESLIDVVTGVSGSGPAYFFLLVECLEAAGTQLGLPAEVARGLAAQTCLGAGKMLLNSSNGSVEDPATLRRNVTSPNGTTEAAIKSLEASGIRETFVNAVKAATARGAELGSVLANQ